MVEISFLLTHLRLPGEGKKEKKKSKFVLNYQKSRKRVVESVEKTRLIEGFRLRDRTVQSLDCALICLSLLNYVLTT